MQFKPDKKPENTGTPINRKDFIKKGLFASLGIALASSPLQSLAQIQNTIESHEKPPMIARPDWDELWGPISAQYKLPLGEKFSISINNKEYIKTVDVLPYLNENFKHENLKNVYRRCIIHHTAMTPNGDAYTQAKDVRDLEISGANGTQNAFNDIAYQFIIALDGTILEGRPAMRVGSHAGATKESSEYKNKYLPGGTKNIADSVGTKQYFNHLQAYINATKMDPDYGSLGISLCGNFDNKDGPSEKQIASLKKLLAWAKTEYDIPTDNIIYHREVKSKVIEASGFTPMTSTVCPGHSFVDHAQIVKDLPPDTQNAKTKTILLDKFI